MIGKTVGILGAAVLGAAAFSWPAAGQEADARAKPIAPFRIADDLYYVGAADYASYLIVTTAGLILIDGGVESMAPHILANVRALGHEPSDVKVLLNSHAHVDHAGGLAALKRASGAALYAMPHDAELMARGGKGDFGLGDRMPYPAVTPDHILKDGQKVRLGDKTLTANLTPGHTRGCTTWTFPITDTVGAKRSTRQVLIHCSSTVLPGYRLVGNESYPGIRADFEKSYRFWRTAPCEIFLGSHGQFFRMNEKLQADRGETNPFYDPQGCRNFYAKAEAAFRAELAKQEAAAR